MIRTRTLPAVALTVFLGATVAQTAPDVAPPPRPGLPPEYKTVANAVKADPKTFKAATTSGAPSGYLGVVIGDTGGKAVVEVVAPDSPAEVAGVKAGDVVAQIDGQRVASATEARDLLRAKLARDEVKLTLTRGGSPVTVTTTLVATTRPVVIDATTRAVLGITLNDAGEKGGGVKLYDVTAGGAADKVRIKAGDVIMKADGRDISTPDGFRTVLGNKIPGDPIDLILMRGEEKLEKRVVTEAEKIEGKGGRFGGGAGGWDDRIPRAWRRADYKLAIIGVEYPDVKHNSKIKDTDWEDSLFSFGTYRGKSATGESVYGSMADYYKELSYGTLKVEGKFVGWFEVSKKRNEYNNGVGGGNERKDKVSLLTEAMDLHAKKAGKGALKDYDGVFFLYAGGSVPNVSRASLYWPHRANVQYDGRSIPYFIVNELRGGSGMMDISVFCHEFGHMIGLPDLYARPEQPGSEGLGQWCAMSNQIGGGRPQHFCAWSKEQLGWVKPTILDPRVKQKLVLSPIEDDPTQCFKVMVRPDGGEYFLLENRKKTGCDSQLPGEGLLIWRVVGPKPILEESHGIEGARGPGSRPDMVPYPSAANNSFTPYTMPSSRSQLGGGQPVWITNIRRLPDGRITFHIGYEYQ